MTRTSTIVKCPYCLNFMEEDGAWWDCERCGYDYNYSDTKGPHHKFEYVLGDWCCALNVYPDLNKTVLTAFHTSYGLTDDDTAHEHGHTHIEIPHAMDDITPDKVADKIKLILMFA